MIADVTMSPGRPAGLAQIEFPAFATGEAFPRVAATMIRDGMDFAADRLRANSRMIDEMRCCSNAMDLAALQHRWFTEATRNYSDATVRLFGHAMELAAATLPETATEGTAAGSQATSRQGKPAHAAGHQIAAE